MLEIKVEDKYKIQQKSGQPAQRNTLPTTLQAKENTIQSMNEFRANNVPTSTITVPAGNQQKDISTNIKINALTTENLDKEIARIQNEIANTNDVIYKNNLNKALANLQENRATRGQLTEQQMKNAESIKAGARQLTYGLGALGTGVVQGFWQIPNYVGNMLGVDNFSNDVLERAERVQNNIQAKATEEGPVASKIAQYGANIGQMAPGIAVNAILPGSGLATKVASGAAFMSSAAGGYYRDAKQRGFTDNQARIYSTGMGALEGLSETISFGKLTEAVENFGIGNIKKAILSQAIGSLENATQEAIMEPAQEGLTTLVGQKADWDNIGQRMLESGIDGAVIYLIMGASGAGIESALNIAEKVQNGENITQQEISQMELDAKSSGIPVEEIKNKYYQEEENAIQKATQSNSISQEQPVNGIRQQAEQLKQQGINIPESTTNVLEKFQTLRNENAPGLTINYDTTLNSDGIIIKRDDGTRQILINPNSNRAIEFVAVHEMLHDFEGSDTYNELSEFVKARAENTEGYEQAKSRVAQMYQDFYKKNGLSLDQLDIENEVVNDMVAKALGNQEFLNELAAKKPNLFQKIYNWFKNVLFDGNNTGKTFNERRADNKFLSELQNKFRKAFEQSYNSQNMQNNKNNPKNSTQSSFSLLGNATDNQGRQLSKQQQEYFKDSKVRDENGNLMIMYHGSNNKFNQFDNSKVGKYTSTNNIQGIWTSSSKKQASEYGDKLITSYVKISNPIDTSGKTLDIDAFIKTFMNYAERTNQKQFAKENVIRSIYEKSNNDYRFLADINKFSNKIDFLQTFKKEMGYDGVIIDDAFTNNTVAIAFESNQIKNIDNTNPTESADIRYSLSESKQTNNYEEYMNRLLERADGDEEFVKIYFKNVDPLDLLKGTDSAFLNQRSEFIKEHESDYDYQLSKGNNKTADGKIVVYNLFKNGNEAKLTVTVPTNEDQNTLWIDELYIKNRNNGFGSEIVNYLKQYAKDKGWKVDVFKELSTATGFWDKVLRNDYSTKYSISEDNQGNKLSKEQQEFFKDSKVRDENGNLLEVYHGTPYEFNIFNYGKLGENTSSLGAGFYFTDKKSTAEEYKKDGGNVKTVYLDIKNPISYGKTTISKNEFDKFVKQIDKETNGQLTADYGNIQDAINEYDYSGDDIDLINSIHNASGLTWEKTYDILRKTIGRDGIISENGFLNNGEKIYVAFNSNQIKNVDNTKPTSNEDIRYSKSNNEWDKYLDKNWDLMPNATRTQISKDVQALNLTRTQEQPIIEQKVSKGTNIADIVNMKPEDVELPNVNYKPVASEGTQTRQFYENVATSQVVNNNIKDVLEPTDIEAKKNVDVLDKVNQKLNADPNGVAMEWATKKNNTFTDEDVALGAILLERYQAQGDTENAVRVIQKLADASTETARALQMYSIFQRLTPEGMQLYEQQKLNNIFREVSQNKTGEWVRENKDKFKLTTEDSEYITAKVEEAQNAKSDRERRIALAEIEARINDKLPPERGQGIKAARRIAMLLNPKTQVRNVMGNAVLTPANYVADLVGTAIDKLVAKRTGVRTTTLPNAKTIISGAKTGINETLEDARLGIKTQPSGNKYEFSTQAKSFNENTKSGLLNAVNNKLNKTERLLNTVMELGDRPFYQAYYENSLEGQMKANGVTEATPDMIDIAQNEALENTWQDDNSYTRTILSIRRAMNNININGFGLGDLIIPFAKTPANLTKAMVEYSPIGLTKSLVSDLKQMNNAISRGEFKPQMQKKFVKNFGKGVAGTLLYVIAGELVKGGFITGGADDDKDVANFEKNIMGIQPYSVKVGDKTYTYNWAQPIATPFAVMADTYELSKEKADIFEYLTTAGKVTIDNLVENSFLQGIKELFSSDYGQTGLGTKLIEAVLDIPGQFTPTFSQQIATLSDSTKRQTFNKGSKLTTMIDEVKNKIPGAKNTLAPQVDTLGNEIKYYGGDNDIFNVFFNPANVSKVNANNTAKELYALYEATQDATILPKQAPYSIDGKDLTPEERAEYQKESGKYVSDTLDALFDSKFYKSLENDAKTEIVNKIVNDADAVAKSKYKETDTSKKVAQVKSQLRVRNVPMADYYNAWYAEKNAEGQKDSKGKTISGTKKKAQQEAVKRAVGNERDAELLYGIFNIK